MSTESANLEQAIRDNENNQIMENRVRTRQIIVLDMWAICHDLRTRISAGATLRDYLIIRGGLIEMAKVVGDLGCPRCPSASYHCTWLSRGPSVDFNRILQPSFFEYRPGRPEYPAHVRHTECLVCERRPGVNEHSVFGRDHIYVYAGNLYSFRDEERSICEGPYHSRPSDKELLRLRLIYA